jgi:hypothetical protein
MRKLFYACLLTGVALVGACSRTNPVAPDNTPPIALSQPPAAAPAQTAHASEQIVFSGEADDSSTFPSSSEVGFWIWCESDEAANPYHGECNGAIQFDALHLTRHVEGEIRETGEDLYEMKVSSTLDGAVMNCTLRNTSEAEHGPHNTVTISCDTPAGSATSHSAVVNVTGPGEE